MPIKFATDEVIKSATDTYVVEKVLSQGAFAHAARARSTALGKPVFLKRYFSPTRALDWYNGFISHQQELKHRISSNEGLKQYSYRFIDFFEGTEGRANKTFHQVFEFVDNGRALTDYIAELAESTARWDQRVTFARVMMMGIAALHAQKIVHTDLKPDNLLLLPNPHSPGNYFLKIIDLDWSIFSDKRAPWHGKGVGYVGTPGYMSPEHMAQLVPTEPSDIFTCGLMLAELLSGGHPFRDKMGDDERLAKAVRAGNFKQFRLLQPIDKVRNPAHLENLINRTFNPDPRQRPTAEDLKNALFGRGEAGSEVPTSVPTPSPPKPAPEPAKPSPTPAPKPAPVPAPKPAPSAPSSVSKQAIELFFDGRSVLNITIDMPIGRPMLKHVSPDAQFLSDPQFKLSRTTSNVWTISPVNGVQNQTLVDGSALVAPMNLRNGMRIAVGNASKGIEKLPLIVKLG